MANGGIIGPPNPVSTCTQAEVITTVTSSTHLKKQTVHQLYQKF
jgi:hypothetical protein